VGVKWVDWKLEIGNWTYQLPPYRPTTQFLHIEPIARKVPGIPQRRIRRHKPVGLV